MQLIKGTSVVFFGALITLTSLLLENAVKVWCIFFLSVSVSILCCSLWIKVSKYNPDLLMSNKDRILKVSKNFKRGVGKLTCLNNEVDPNEPFNLSNEMNEQVTGSGFFIRHSSIYLPRESAHHKYCLTNAHVVEGSSTKRITISFPHLGDTVLWGEVILACRALDFAVIEVRAENNAHLEKELGQTFSEVFKTIPFIKMCSDPVNTNTELAKDVLAIGYPLDSNDAHISTGCISGKHEHYLQINGSINSGNSGGPLFDADGICIGINAASFEESEGITLAVEFHHITKMLKHYWNGVDLVIYPPSLGIRTKKLIDSYAQTKLKDENIKGVLVSDVHEENCFGIKLKKGDVILSIGDQRWEFDIDRSGNVSLPFQHQKVQFYCLNTLLLLDSNSCFVRVYSKNKRKTIPFKLKTMKNTVKHVMPSIEPIACFSCGGLIFTQLTKNHMEEVPEDVDPNVINFFTNTHGSEKAVVISSYHIPCSLIEQGYNIRKLTVIKRINKTKISTIDQCKNILMKILNSHKSDPDNKRYKFIEIMTENETLIMDVSLAFKIEMLLEMTPSFKKEFSIVNNLKRKISEI